MPRCALVLLLILLAVLLAASPAALAEGVLRQRPMLPDGSIPLHVPQHPCTPGQNATDPDCREARRLDCLGSCRHDFSYNGDMMYLRWCERGCEEKGER